MSSNNKHFNGAKTADDERHGKTYVKRKKGQLDRQQKKEKMMIFLTKLNLKMP